MDSLARLLGRAALQVPFLQQMSNAYKCVTQRILAEIYLQTQKVARKLGAPTFLAFRVPGFGLASTLTDSQKIASTNQV